MNQQPASNSLVAGDSSLSQIPSTEPKINDNKKQQDNRQNTNSTKKSNENVMGTKKIESKSPSALDNYRNQANRSSLRNSPQLAAQGIASNSPIKGN